MEIEKNEPLHTAYLIFVIQKSNVLRRGMQLEPMDLVKLKLNDRWSFVKIGLNLHMTTRAFSRYEMKEASLDS